MNPEGGLWANVGEGEKKVHCGEREVNLGGEGEREKEREKMEEKNSDSPGWMEAAESQSLPN